MTRRGLLKALASASLCKAATHSQPFWNPPRRLLLDTRLIGRTEGVRLTLGTVEKERRNPLFGEDKPWEVKFDNLYANVMFDAEDGLFKCWYNPFIGYPQYEAVPRERRASVAYDSVPKGETEMGVCYATSRDGLAWTKPDLGIVEYKGSRHNNLLLRKLPAPSKWNPHGSGVWKDLADRDPARRYKIFFSRPKQEMAVSFSADGIHWGDPILCPEIASRGDTHNNSFWSPTLNRYVGFTRNFDDRARARLVARTESKDFLHWTKAEEVMRSLPGEPERQTYALIAFPYANVYLGFVMLLNRGDKIVKTDPHNDTVDCELAWSPDTVKWERVCPGVSLIPHGPSGSYDSGCIYAAAYPILREGRLWLYYGGNNGKHSDWRDGFFNLARLRLDGFAGYEAQSHGLIETQPIEWDGVRLLVNADAKSGSVRIKAMEGDRTIGESQPLSGTLTDAPVTWRKPLPRSGKPLRLRFELQAATLYSFTTG